MSNEKVNVLGQGTYITFIGPEVATSYKCDNDWKGLERNVQVSKQTFEQSHQNGVNSLVLTWKK